MNKQYEFNDPNRLKDLDYLKQAYEDFDSYDSDADLEAIYAYAELLYYGSAEVEADKEKAKEAFAKLFICLQNSGQLFFLEPEEYYNKETDTIERKYPDEDVCKSSVVAKYKDIFLGAEFFTREEIGPTQYLLDIAEIIQRGIPGVLDPDPKRAFDLVYSMPPIYGMVGGFELVQNILIEDLKKLFLADCYMYGKGTEQDLPMALTEFLSYRTDHLAQKRHSNLITDELDKLYVMLKESDDSALPESQLPMKYCALAVMAMEGIGCTPNPEAALKYYLKSKEIYDNTYIIHYGLDELNGYFGFDFKHFLRLLSSNVNTRAYVKGMYLGPGMHIYLGRYNNRAVSWRVLEVKDGKALILSDEVLESSRIIGSRSMDDNWATDWAIDSILDLNDETEGFVYDADEETGKCFLLSEEQVDEYLPEIEDRLCYYREQAYANATDNEEINPNKLAPWWLLSSEDKDSDVHRFVGEDGNIYESDYHRDLGIRPAMYVKVVD